MKDLIKKIGNTFMASILLIASMWIYPVINVRAEDNNTKLEIQSDNSISIDTTDSKKLVYKIGDVIVGNVKVKSGNEYLTPTLGNEGKFLFTLPKYSGETYQVTLEVRPSEGYDRQPSYFYNESSSFFPGDNNVGLDITANDIHYINFKFEATSNPNPQTQNPVNNPGSQTNKTITIGGNPTMNGSTFEYLMGNMIITKNGNPVDTASFTATNGDQIAFTLTPNPGYGAKLQKQNTYVELTNNNSNSAYNSTYSYTISDTTESTLLFTPSFEDPPVEAMKFDFTINGVDFTNVGLGDTVTVPDDFNMDELEEFYVTKIAIEGAQTFNYEREEYSYEMLDNRGRKIFETTFTKTSDNYGFIRIESHSGDILSKDIRAGKTISDYFGFYITGINFAKNAFKGVEVSTDVMPDNYDFTMWNGADLSGTTKENPGKVTAYYGEDTISFSSKVLSKISEISIVSDSGIPSSAVSINNETGEITILSNYYNEIPLQIKLEDGTIGYITVNRIGIFISDVNKGNDTLYHGAFAMVSGNLNVDKDKYRIAAVFYHEDTKTYEDYDLIVNITYDDGTTETKIAQGVGDIHNGSGNIIGSDYILWKGNSNTPKKISVTAVRKGALSNENTFGGATFGSGSGVEWERTERGNE